MGLNEIKQLSLEDFAARYPFLHARTWNPITEEYSLDYFPDDPSLRDGLRYKPRLVISRDALYGWTDLLLCWAEKVRQAFIDVEGNVPSSVFITEIKEKYGMMRVSFNGVPIEPFNKVMDYTYMLEHLSKYVCYSCGHISRTKKKLVTFRPTDGWVMYQCRKCAKRITYENIKDYGIDEKLFKKWLHANPHYGLYRSIFDSEWVKKVGSWTCKVRSFKDGKWSVRLLNCKELFEGVADEKTK